MPGLQLADVEVLVFALMTCHQIKVVIQKARQLGQSCRVASRHTRVKCSGGAGSQCGCNADAPQEATGSARGEEQAGG